MVRHGICLIGGCGTPFGNGNGNGNGICADVYVEKRLKAKRWEVNGQCVSTPVAVLQTRGEAQQCGMMKRQGMDCGDSSS